MFVKDESKEAAIASLSESASKIDPSHFAAFVAEKTGGVPERDLWRFNFYLKEVFSQVSPLPWFNMLKTSPLSDVPLSIIPKSVYETAADWINKLPSESHWKFVMWALDRLLIDWAAHAKGQEQPFILYHVATLVELAMVLRAEPDSLTGLLPMLRCRPMYHGQDKLPLIVWMMSHAYQEDLPAALYSWGVNLLPLVVSDKCCYSSHSIHLILQFVEMRILSSNPEARAILVNGSVRHGERLIPPCSFEMLVRLTFPAPSARVEEATTQRFEAIYPLLKEVALAPAPDTSANALKQIFTFSLELAGQKGNPALANEATAIAFSVLTQNVDCFKQWDVLYKENLEASVALLKKLVDEWEDHAPKLLSSSPSDTLTVKHAMNSFRMKNEIAITEGVANLSLYKEADKSCKLISTILTPGSGMYLNKSNPNAAKMDPSDLKLVEAAEEIEKAILSLSEAAKKMDPSPLAAYLDQVLDDDWFIPARQMLKLIHYYGDELSQVSFQWVKMFQDYPLSKLIHVPLSLIPKPVYEKTVDFINLLPFETILPGVVLWASDFILTEWPRVVVKVEQKDKSKVAAFVVLAMVLRTRPDALTLVLPELRERPTYQGHDKLPVIIWMMAQASQGDLCAGLYSWVRNLLPLVANNKDYSSSQSTHLILQFVEMILSSNPEARAVLLNGAVRHGEWLIPPCSFEMLVRLTFPLARVEEATERFQAIYPLLKEVALAPDTSVDALKQIFTFSLKLAGQKGNPALVSEATAMAISVLTRNVDCFKQWDVLYKENLEASVGLLKKLVDEWEDHAPKLLSSSSSDTLTVKHAMNSFRMKNEIAITDGVDSFLYEEAHRWCQLISRRLTL